EALLRWRHPEHGQVSPALFVDVAEQSGLNEVIGPQVMRAACMDARGWQREVAGAQGLFVSVNVSPRQLRAGDLAAYTEAVLRETVLALENLHIDLAETAVIVNEARGSSVWARLRN